MSPTPGALTLIGQFDSPFVRRVGIALTAAAIPFAHLPWSVFGDGERIRPINPLMRVPTLVLEDGMALVDSFAMLDHVDRRAKISLRASAHDAAARIEGLAVGMAEKAVSLFYEHRLHREVSALWSKRCRQQMQGAAAALEAEAVGAEAVGRSSPFWFDGRLTHADIAVACAWRFVSEAHPGLVEAPGLAAHAADLEALPVFRAVFQSFVPPA